MNILLVKDDPDPGEATTPRLRGLGHQVIWNTTREGMPDNVATGQIDTAALALTLPSGDGNTILRGLRRTRLNLPVLVITARTEIADKVGLLELGADDYLVTPSICASPRHACGRSCAALRVRALRWWIWRGFASMRRGIACDGTAASSSWARASSGCWKS